MFQDSNNLARLSQDQQDHVIGLLTAPCNLLFSRDLLSLPSAALPFKSPVRQHLLWGGIRDLLNNLFNEAEEGSACAECVVDPHVNAVIIIIQASALPAKKSYFPLKNLHNC